MAKINEIFKFFVLALNRLKETPDKVTMRETYSKLRELIE